MPASLAKKPDINIAWQAEFDAFVMLSLVRRRNEFGAHPITFQEIAAYCAVFEVSNPPWLAEVIVRADLKFRQYVASKAPKDGG